MGISLDTAKRILVFGNAQIRFSPKVLVGDIKARTTYEFFCIKCGCTFERSWSDVRKSIEERKNPCTKCNGFVNEELCRYILSELLAYPFHKVRPEWLSNEEGTAKLELDGYCEDLNLAFEYQGEQHYKSWGWITDEDVASQQQRDELKAKRCASKGVQLLVIEPIQVANKSLEEQIRDQLEFHQISLRKQEVDWSGYRPPRRLSAFEKAEIHASRMGYTLIKPSKPSFRDSDYQFLCSVSGHDEPISAQEINLGRARPSCKSCGYLKGREKRKQKYHLNIDELAELGRQCSPPMELLEWAGCDENGDYLYRCTAATCEYVHSYTQKQLMDGSNGNVCANCKPNAKPRVRWEHVYARVSMLGGTIFEETHNDSGKLTKETILKLSCFNADHEVFELSVRQLLDDDGWCTKHPCNERKVKKAVLSAEEIEDTIIQYFDVTFVNAPQATQSSEFDLSCNYCGSQLGRKYTYKKLKKRRSLECDVCRKKLGEGWAIKKKGPAQ